MQERGEETHRKILDTALELFSRQGYNAAGVAEICQAAGISKGAFYHHFPSKQALFLELLTRWLDRLEQALDVSRLQVGNSADALLKMAEQAAEVSILARGQIPMFLEFWTQASRDQQVWKATIDPYRRYEQYFTTLVQEGIREGVFRPVDPETTARLIVSLAAGMILQGALDPQAADWPLELQKSMNILFSGLKKE